MAQLTKPERVIRKWVLRFMHWRHRQRIVSVVLLVMVIGGGFLLQIKELGELLIAVYGLVALLVGIRSSDTFKMSIIAVVLVPLLFILRSNQMAKNFSVYAFMLLGIGIVCAMAEEWRRTKKSKKA
jgi:hypothetical protein